MENRIIKKLPLAPYFCRTLLTALMMLILIGCGPTADDRYDAGYADGYAVGYNTTLQIRATLIEGAWDDKNYSRGYAEGVTQGIADAKRKTR